MTKLHRAAVILAVVLSSCSTPDDLAYSGRPVGSSEAAYTGSPKATGSAEAPIPSGSASTGGAGENPVAVENGQAGSAGWQLLQSGHRVSDDTNQQIKGFASAVSVNKGESLTLYVTVNPAQTYTVAIYRIGWYDGMGGRLMAETDDLAGISQPACPMDEATGLLACLNWEPGYTIEVPDGWTSGIYIAMLTNEESFQDPVTFVVRDDARDADLLYQQSVTTYQAYNNYPAGAGKSLYPATSSGPDTIGGDPRAVAVSFDRPYTSDRNGGAGDLYRWEIYMVRWLERSGYDVAYTTNVDTHANGARILGYSGFLSVGHDEYYSKEMYDALEAARDSGVGLGFFGANAVHWQVRFEPSSDGAPNRVMVCYKLPDIDPVTDPALKTIRWRSALVDRPEQRLIGIQSDIVSGNESSLVVVNSDHWIYEGTGFSDGSAVPDIVHHEADAAMPEYPVPDSVTYTLVAESPFGGKTQNSVIYQAPSGAWVFGAGTIGWSWGLDDWNGINFADEGIQRTTKNVLDAFIQSPVQP